MNSVEANILELIKEFKNDRPLQNALQNKDRAWLTDIMLHRNNMSMHMLNFNEEYLFINGDNYDRLEIYFDENFNIKSAYYYDSEKHYKVNIDNLKAKGEWNYG